MSCCLIFVVGRFRDGDGGLDLVAESFCVWSAIVVGVDRDGTPRAELTIASLTKARAGELVAADRRVDVAALLAARRRCPRVVGEDRHEVTSVAA